jgi:hypothetical protein
MKQEAAQLDRRELLLQAAAGLAIAGLAKGAIGAETAPPAAAAPAPPTGTGKPGEFAFLHGEWKIAHRRLKDPVKKEWDEFPGEATCWTILGGVGSVEELRIPARSFSGMGLRLLDVENKVWHDFWVNSRSGVLAPPGLRGTFVDGAGIFEADEMDGETPIKVRGVWDRITPTSCRWHQAVSRDGGKSWEGNWFMDWTRVG